MDETNLDQSNLDQEARIALLDHYRSFAQFWSTIILTLAIAFLSLVQYKPPPLLFAIFAVLIFIVGIYSVTGVLIHTKLCWLTVTFAEKREPEENQTPYLNWLHKKLSDELSSQWHGIGGWLNKMHGYHGLIHK
jgi:hypothetical protein